MNPRLIFHVDMDAFYASVEQRDHPEYRGLPVIVGGSERRGVVSTCSYEARKFGVHSAQPMTQAMRLCPQAIIAKPRMSAYVEASEIVMGILSDFSPDIEPLSLDEAFLNMTGTEELFGPPREAAQAIKDAISAATELTCSVGIAPNKFLAKIASDLEKPDGITHIPHGEEREFIAPLSIRKIWGVGPKSAERLERLGLFVIDDIARADIQRLRRALGAHYADHIQRLANGIDDREVVRGRGRKSVGSETTLFEDVRGFKEVSTVLRSRCDKVGRALRKKGLQARGVRVKVRHSKGFQTYTRQAVLHEPTNETKALFLAAQELLHSVDIDQGIRLVGAAAFDLEPIDKPTQLGLFQSNSSKKNKKLDAALDAIEDKFGKKVVRGSDVRTPTEPDS